jgi:hypothetical protein
MLWPQLHEQIERIGGGFSGAAVLRITHGITHQSDHLPITRNTIDVDLNRQNFFDRQLEYSSWIN